MVGKVCNCYDVLKADLVKSIRKLNLESIVDVQFATKASTGCGRCKPVVVGILEKELQKRSNCDGQLRLPL